LEQLTGAASPGDRSAAAQSLWQHYFAQLVRLARDRLWGAPRQAADEEDVALSAFKSFCCAVDRGRFPRLDDRDDLWQVLVLITVRKAADLANRERRRQPAGGSQLERNAFDDVIAREPDPALAAELAEQYRRLLDALGDGVLRAVAQAKMEGLTNEEIQMRLNLNRSAVERKLRLIRSILERRAQE
jgi:DNA-directed RNA polymerase specialized sigma24 family protein